MNRKNVFTTCAVAGVLLMSGMSNAAILVSISPTATNPGAAPPGQLNTGIFGTSNFTTSGAIGGLASQLSINGFGLAAQAYTETGVINFTNFNGGTTGGLTGLLDPSFTYGMYANFALSGIGNWSANVFNATTAILTLGEVYGIHTGGTITGPGNVLLGTLALNYAQPLTATATLGLGGTALTSLTASFTFSPAAGTTGVNGFFQSNNVFNMDISGANIGGNYLNTSYSPNPAIVGSPVVISVPGTQPNLGPYPGSVNVTFENRVPEPGALSLVAMALIGLGIVSRRKAAAEA